MGENKFQSFKVTTRKSLMSCCHLTHEEKTHYVIRLHDNLDNQKIFAYIYICNIYIYTWKRPRENMAVSMDASLFTAKCPFHGQMPFSRPNVTFSRPVRSANSARCMEIDFHETFFTAI